MAIVKCPNNHYYDDTRYTSCPYCEKLDGVNPNDLGINEQLTSYFASVVEDYDSQMTEGYGEYVTDFQKTIGIFTDESQNLLTVAWLVCVEGFQKGKSYVIHSGRNFAGRSLDMDIVLADDNEISREKHFSIVYDPKSISFYLVSGSGHTYINGEAAADQQVLTDGDTIQAGQSKYIFVPFCKEGREWN